ncbi:hypothetical protein RQM47_11480 [Rubrivirga sp. S365]|uniref:hypothetical protein n=1 Tax=Rubrivirga sp. S365 TaxID=3076080 RepID=UPI0028C855FB|nr:hypothetical protein [Rubrivirga sp. S365]MDT7857261.1 hypothetical protein [Rubrivirga sp. S365]
MSTTPPLGRLALLLALALAACGPPYRTIATTTVELPEPPPVERPSLPPRPAPAPPEATVEPAPPPAPEPAPKGTVEARSVYPQADGPMSEVAEWTLVSGATVVYAHQPGAEAAHVVAFAGGGAALADTDAASVADALAVVRGLPAAPADVTAVVVGSETSAAVEGAVGRVLGGAWGRSSGLAGATAPPPNALRVRADLDDDAALLVFEEALRRRLPSARVALDAADGAAALWSTGGAGWGDALRPFSRAEAEAARSAVAARALRSGAFAARALADLYRAPGARRPARPPAFALGRLGRVRAVSADALSTLAARFAAAR